MIRKYIIAISIIVAFGAVALSQDVGLKITSKPVAAFTEEARRNNTVGEVTLNVQFLQNGKIGEINVVAALPDGLVEQAIAAASKIKFEPKRVNGVAVSETKTIEYSFDIAVLENDPDIKRKLKITRGPDIRFSASEEKVLGGHRYKILVVFSRTGIATIDHITPAVPEDLRQKFEEAIRSIVFEPALLRNGKRVSVIKSFDFK